MNIELQIKFNKINPMSAFLIQSGIPYSTTNATNQELKRIIQTKFNIKSFETLTTAKQPHNNSQIRPIKLVKFEEQNLKKLLNKVEPIGEDSD